MEHSLSGHDMTIIVAALALLAIILVLALSSCPDGIDCPAHDTDDTDSLLSGF